MAPHIPQPGLNQASGTTGNQDGPAVKGLGVPEREKNRNTYVSELWGAACEAPMGTWTAGTEAPELPAPAGCGGQAPRKGGGGAPRGLRQETTRESEFGRLGRTSVGAQKAGPRVGEM